MTNHLLAPLSDPSEVEMLVGAGATRLYCGISPRAWTRRFTRAVWLTRRSPSADLPDLDSLAQVVDTARARGVDVHLALNAPTLTPEQLPVVVDIARQATREMGVGAVIAADPALMLSLGEAGVPFVASTVAVAHNAEALRFFRDLGAVGAVLPRHLRLSEVRALAREVRDLALEALVLFDGCAWEEGLCRTSHAIDATTAFCRVPWEYRPVFLGDGEPWVDEEVLATAMEDYRAWLDWSDACGAPLSDGRLPNGACGLCALHALSRSGIRCFKVAGRQASPYRRFRGVQMVRSVLDSIERGRSRAVACEDARSLRDTPDICESALMCLYPETAPRR